MRRESRCCFGNCARLFTLYLAASTHLILYSQTAAYSTTSITAELANELGIRLYELLSQNEHGNIVISPLGMTLALGVARLGAKENKAKEMDRIMEWSPRTIHRQLKRLRNRITIARNDQVYVEVRNFLFGGGKHVHGLRAKFRKVIKYYSSKTKLMKSINKELLQQLVGEAYTKTVFVSRVKLDAHWEIPFCLFTNSSFNIPRQDGSPDKTIQTHYMGFISDEYQWNYFNDKENNCQVIELNYGKDHVADEWEPRYNPADISMVIALPHSGYPLRNLEEGLTVQKVKDWLSKMTPTNVDVSIPKFNLSRLINVASLFTKLTTLDSFTDTKAKHYGTVSSVWQAASIAASETGSSSEYLPEVLSIPLLSKPENTFYANRPFVFLVRDKTTDSILYLGRVVNPNIN